MTECSLINYLILFFSSTGNLQCHKNNLNLNKSIKKTEPATPGTSTH